MRLMYDGINTDVPAIRKLNPNMVAGYVDGRYAWSAADWEGWNSRCVAVRIAVFPATNKGDVIDCENGDATPAQAAQWIRMRKAAGYYRPTVYCNRGTIPAVRSATGSLVLGSDYDIWAADWTGAAHQVTAPGPGAAVKLPATQFKSGQLFDTSMVYDDWWPHSGAPKPAIPPVTNVSAFESGTVNLKFRDGSSKTFTF